MGEYDAEVSRGEVETQGKKGCLGCSSGCIIAICIFLLIGVIAVGVGGYYAWNKFIGVVNQYTDPSPEPLPEVKLDPKEREAVVERAEAFDKAIEAKEDTEPLVLTADEINAFIATEQPDLKDRVRIGIVGDDVTGQVSMPFTLPGQTVRYLNAKGTFKVALIAGMLEVRMVAGEVKGKPLNEPTLLQLKSQNWAESVNKNPKFAKVLERIKDIQVRDGKVYIIPKTKGDLGTMPEPKTESSEPTKDNVDKPKIDDATKGIEPKPEPKPEPKSEEQVKPDETPKSLDLGSRSAA